MRYLKIRRAKNILFLNIENCNFTIKDDLEKLKISIYIQNITSGFNMDLTIIEATSELEYYEAYNNLIEQINNWDMGGEITLTLSDFNAWSDSIWERFNQLGGGE